MENKNELVTIIIPVYNKEKTIKKCIKSVINQTFKNWRIIIINDASNDHSQLICDDFCKKYKNINLINLKNNGGGRQCSLCWN